MWTVKEAYTKALGIGLGFDFNRVQYDVLNNRLTVDGIILRGWQFVAFNTVHPHGEENSSRQTYQTVVARFTGGTEETRVEFRSIENGPSWLLANSASTIVEQAVII